MLAKAILTLYILFPVTLLTSQALPSGVFYTLLITSVMLLVHKKFANALHRTTQYKWLIASYSALFVTVALSSWYHGEWAGANSEGALRFLLGVWVLLLALTHIDQKLLRQAAWGIYLASTVSMTILVWLVSTAETRPTTPALIIVTYTSLMLLLCAFSVYMLKWQLTNFPKLESVTKTLVITGTFTVFLAAQTRTGLLGLPIFIILALILFIGVKRPRKIIVLFAASIALVAAAVVSSDAMRTRITQGIEEVQACKGENSRRTSSMCIRIQLWHTAIDAGLNHPWTGLGRGSKFIDYLEEVALPRKWTSRYVINEYFGEPHNDLMLMFASFGFPGLLSLLLIYLTPCAYLIPRLLKREADPTTKVAAAMGLALCLGFLAFGLTETMFRRMNTIGFYAAMVALFMVLSESSSSGSKSDTPCQ